MEFDSHVAYGLPVRVVITYVAAEEKATRNYPGARREVEFELHWRKGGRVTDAVLRKVREIEWWRLERECWEHLDAEAKADAEADYLAACDYYG